jgi:DivIVA domain-containing protein
MDDVSSFLVFLAIVLIGVTAIFGTDLGAKIFRKKPSSTPLTDGGFEEPVASLPPVLLPEEAKPDDIDRVRFALGLRGYRMDQVDQVLDELRDQLAASRHEVEILKARLEAVEEAGPAAGTAAEPSAGTGAQAEPPVAETHGQAEAGSGSGGDRA